MKKNLLLIIIGFIAGFTTHALFFPDFLANGITTIPDIIIPNTVSTQPEKEKDTQLTIVSFDGSKFNRHNVTVGFTRYIKIINNNQDKLMWLISSEPSLSTPRGYGYTEALQMQFNKKGQFVVADKNNPKERLVITVK